MKTPKELLNYQELESIARPEDINQNDPRRDILDDYFYYNQLIDDRSEKVENSNFHLRLAQEIRKKILSSLSPENRKTEKEIGLAKTKIMKIYHRLWFEQAIKTLEKQWIEKEPLLYSKFIDDTWFKGFPDIDNYISKYDNKENFKIKADIVNPNKIWNIQDLLRYETISLLVNFSIDLGIFEEFYEKYGADDTEETYKRFLPMILEKKDKKRTLQVHELYNVNYLNLSNRDKIKYLTWVLSSNLNEDILIYDINRVVGYDTNTKIKWGNVRYLKIKGIEWIEDISNNYIDNNKEYSVKDLLELMVIWKLELFYWMYIIEKDKRNPDIIEYINPLNQFLCSAKFDLIYK